MSRLTLGELVAYLTVDDTELDRGLSRAERKMRDTADKAAPLGAATGGAYAEGVRKQIEAGLRALPEIHLDADSSAAAVAIANVRRQLEELHSQRIGIDIDEGQALSQVRVLTDELRRLGAESPSVRVQTDTARAAAELAEIGAEVDRLNGRHATVSVDVNRVGSGGLGGLMGAAALMSPGLIPLGAAGLGLGAGATAIAGASAGGLGTLLLGFQGVTAGVKALGQEQAATAQDAATSSRSQVASAASIANAQRGVQSAVAALHNAQASARDGEINAAQAVTSAVTNQRQAEQSLAAAQTQALTAQRAITDARKAAKQAAEDLGNQVKDGALAQRQAILDVSTAQAGLTAAQKLTGAGADQQRAQAQLTYDQAVQHLTELQTQNGRLAEQQKAATKAGIDGSPQVVAAQQRVAQANQGVVAAQDRVQAASVAVATAVRAQATQQRQAAYSVSQAQAGVASALAQVAAAHRQVGTAGATAMSKVNAELAKLSPATVDFARFVQNDLLPRFEHLQGVAAAGLLPGVEEGIHALLGRAPEVQTFLGNMSQGLGNVATEAGNALAGPEWDDFFSFVERTAVPDLVEFLHTLGNVGRGLAGLLVAFGPVEKQIGDGLLHLSERFADFGANAGSSSDFQGFLRYVEDSLPVAADAVLNLARAVGTLLQALAPLGTSLLLTTSAIAGFLGHLSPGQLLAIAEAAGALFLAFRVGLVGLRIQALETATAVGVLNAVMDANPLGLVALAVTGVVAGLAFLKANSLGAADAAGTFDHEQGLLTASTKALNDEIQRSIDKMTILRTGALDVASANVGWAGALDAVRTSLEKNGSTLSLNTAAGQANQQTIIAATRALNDKVTADFKANESTMGYKKALEKAATELDTQKRKLEDVMVQGGMTREEARKYAGQLLLTKGDFKAKFETPGLKIAQAQVDHYNESISKYDGKTIAIKMALAAVPGSSTTPAQGGIGSLLLPGVGKATGGPISGPGSGTSDTAGLFALSNGEHVWTASEVAAAGGHSAVEAMRRGVLGMATGGPVVSTAFGTNLAGKISAGVSSSLSDALLALAGGGIGGITPGAPTNPTGNAALGRRLAYGWGWGGPEWDAMYAQLKFESGWNNTAQNPTSTAYGIAQFLDSTWAGVGLAKTSDAATQLEGYHRYVGARYGDPLRSWAFERQHNYYDQGGVAVGRGFMPKNTLRPERVLSPQQTESFDRLVDALDRKGNAAPGVRVFIGERELTDIVRVEVDGHAGDMAQALTHGAAL